MSFSVTVFGCLLGSVLAGPGLRGAGRSLQDTQATVVDSEACQQPVELIFILDGSGSVGSSNFHDVIKEFAKGVVKRFDIGTADVQSRVASVTYSSSPRLDFNFGAHNSTNAAIDGISAITYPRGGTMTAKALHFVNDEILPTRRPSTKTVLILLTDGSSSDSNQIEGIATQMHDDGVTIYSVGVGSGIRFSELALSASPPSEDHVLEASFDNLGEFASSLSSKVCSAPTSDWLEGLFVSGTSGEGTYHGPHSPTGHCRLDGAHTPEFVTRHGLPTVAINGNQYNGSRTCGMCVRISSNATTAETYTNDNGLRVNAGHNPYSILNNGESFVAMVDDSCFTADCMAGHHLDLKLDLDGRWGISWKAVECPLATTDVIDYYFEGSSGWFIKLQARGVRYPVASLEAKLNGEWVVGTRTADNFFTFEGLPGLNESASFDVRLKAEHTGELLADTVSRISSVNDVAITGTGVQFAVAGNANQQPLNQQTAEQMQSSSQVTTHAPTTAPTPVGGCCSWHNNECGDSPWCSATQARCEGCGGAWVATSR